ncbi:hypothetical protein MPTK1_7g14680 [Marchantia polymorpha subsp. ruderalis]|uniref:Uncharacterized protein n=2 Tax=Marchantia polymorpha TaxID=3197 RepID=A0AAF6BZM4_MARPO|nr:hypothetical protein MARPO_0009s0153 [Marchantia polymorpha]BBN17458.1 hypothetical protein Mp_7g14680 [Marchantia polymorpha subsp. ruderalis]|eukprot:PTQ47064.1 hypothetical protein MARPO_0009s0153 [Marchantia polymorpha]
MARHELQTLPSSLQSAQSNAARRERTTSEPFLVLILSPTSLSPDPSLFSPSDPILRSIQRITIDAQCTSYKNIPGSKTESIQELNEELSKGAFRGSISRDFFTSGEFEGNDADFGFSSNSSIYPKSTLLE